MYARVALATSVLFRFDAFVEQTGFKDSRIIAFILTCGFPCSRRLTQRSVAGERQYSLVRDSPAS